MTDLTPRPNGYPIKLVRDKTPEIINTTGEPGDLFYGPLPEGEDREKWLRKKLVEEVAEYVAEPSYNELADVLAVVKALAVEHDGSLGGLDALDRCDKRGGFFDGVMMFGRHPEFDGE